KRLARQLDNFFLHRRHDASVRAIDRRRLDQWKPEIRRARMFELISIATTLWRSRATHLRGPLGAAIQSVLEINVPTVALHLHVVLRARVGRRLRHHRLLQVTRGKAKHLFALASVYSVDRHCHDTATSRASAC